MNALSINREHKKLFGYIGAGVMIDAYDIYLMAGVSAAFVASGFAGLNQLAIFMSMTFVGLLIGAATVGFVGDRYGRRFSYQFNLLVMGISGFAAALAPTFEFLVVARLVMGIGLGAELVLAGAVLGEFIPSKNRGRWAAYLGILAHLGLVISTAIGAVVISNFGWRWMFVIGAVSAIIVWIARTNCPESPRWLATQGRFEEAMKVVDKFEKHSQTTLGDAPVTIPEEKPATKETVKRPFWQLAVLGAVVAAGVNMFVYGLISWMPTFFVAKGIKVSDSLAYTALITLGAPAGGFLCLLLVDRINRRTAILLISIIIIPLSLAYATSQSIVMVISVGVVLVTAIYALVTFVLYTYLPELYPTKYRLRGTGLSHTLARAATIGVPFVMSGLFLQLGILGPIGFVCAVAVCMIVVVIAIPVETRARSLEEIA